MLRHFQCVYMIAHADVLVAKNQIDYGVDLPLYAVVQEVNETELYRCVGQELHAGKSLPKHQQLDFIYDDSKVT